MSKQTCSRNPPQSLGVDCTCDPVSCRDLVALLKLNPGTNPDNLRIAIEVLTERHQRENQRKNQRKGNEK